MTLYREFINISKTLNKDLDIIPVLYGSLGLEKVTGLDLNPQDIDILVPLTYLEDKWELLKSAVEKIGYEMTDIYEHSGASFYTVSISDYKKVYNRSLLDGYRRTKNNNKDQGKVELLDQLVKEPYNKKA